VWHCKFASCTYSCESGVANHAARDVPQFIAGLVHADILFGVSVVGCFLNQLWDNLVVTPTLGDVHAFCLVDQVLSHAVEKFAVHATRLEMAFFIRMVSITTLSRLPVFDTPSFLPAFNVWVRATTRSLLCQSFCATSQVLLDAGKSHA